MVNVLITGVSGFVGRNVLDHLSTRFTTFGILRRNVPLSVDTPLLIKHPEKMEWKFYRDLIENNEISAIVHIGAITGERKRCWRDYYQTNVLWTKNLALGFERANVNHRLFIFVSSVGVYGTNPVKLPADEETPRLPDGKYHKSKVLAERELMGLDIPLLILRPTIMYGYYDYGFLLKVFKLVKRGLFPFSRDPKIHLLDVENVGRVCELAIKRRITGTFNLCDDEPLHLLELLEFVRNIVGGGYLRIPICSIAKMLVDSLKIRLKLICFDWYYDGSKAKEKFTISFGQTLENLKKYICWYSRLI